MSYTYLLEQGEESSAEYFSDIPVSVLSKLNLTQERCSCSARETESCQSSPSGTTFEPLTQRHGVNTLTSCAAGSHARTLAQPVKASASLASEAAFGLNSPESFAKLHLDTSSWKTPHCFALAGLDEFSETWPLWGMMHNGECWELKTPDLSIPGPACGYLLPTPSGTSNHGKNHVSGRLDEWGGSGNLWRGTEIGRLHCPRFEEWLMGWPDQWTELTPYETAKFQQWLHSHGKCSPSS